VVLTPRDDFLHFQAVSGEHGCALRGINRGYITPAGRGNNSVAAGRRGHPALLQGWWPKKMGGGRKASSPPPGSSDGNVVVPVQG